MFASLPELEQAPTERGVAMVHDGTWPVEGLLAFQTGDVLEDKSDGEPADFDIDSDASDADLLELK